MDYSEENTEYPIHRREHHGYHARSDDIDRGKVAISVIGCSKNPFPDGFVIDSPSQRLV